MSVGTVLLPGAVGTRRFCASGSAYRERLVRAPRGDSAYHRAGGGVLDLRAGRHRRPAVQDRGVRRRPRSGLTASAFLFHMMGLPFIGANRILAPAFYARGDTATPALSGIVAVAGQHRRGFRPAAGHGRAGHSARAVNCQRGQYRPPHGDALEGGHGWHSGSALASVALYCHEADRLFRGGSRARSWRSRRPFQALFGKSGAGLVAYGLAVRAVRGDLRGHRGRAPVRDEGSGGAFLVSSFRGGSKRRSNLDD
ncbi:MAG: hypothetical protein M0C28_31210 [Candidatus Moduliflexus flocculans]|nr:hypothetical protein [Candidatus Moduliflexus flocculans]